VVRLRGGDNTENSLLMRTKFGILNIIIISGASTQNFEKKSTLFSAAGSGSNTWPVVLVVMVTCTAVVHFI
jgi:hypothetical protein